MPEEHELLALLGEPRLADPHIPWMYNRLSFEITSGNDVVELTVEPASGDLLLQWRGEEPRVTLELHGVETLAVETEHGREYLVAGFPDSFRERPLRLQLRPRFSVYWGTGP